MYVQQLGAYARTMDLSLREARRFRKRLGDEANQIFIENAKKADISENRR